MSVIIPRQIAVSFLVNGMPGRSSMMIRRLIACGAGDLSVRKA
jgi:hypothetical protein